MKAETSRCSNSTCSLSLCGKVEINSSIYPYIYVCKIKSQPPYEPFSKGQCRRQSAAKHDDKGSLCDWMDGHCVIYIVHVRPFTLQRTFAYRLKNAFWKGLVCLCALGRVCVCVCVLQVTTQYGGQVMDLSFFPSFEKAVKASSSPRGLTRSLSLSERSLSPSLHQTYPLWCHLTG